MWQQVDSILASFLEAGDVVMVPDADKTIVHILATEGWSDGVITIYGTDDEWGEQFEYNLPDDFYLPLMMTQDS